MKKIALAVIGLLFADILFSQYTNVMISDVNDPEEVSICINPKNTNQIVAGANLNNYFYSDNGGLTWTYDILEDSENGVWGDPIIFTDTTGNFYYSHLSNPPPSTINGSWVDRIVFTKSLDGGVSWWQAGTSVGKNNEKVQDKEGIAVNRMNNEIYVTWTQFDEYGSSNPLDSSIILFSKSTDAGLTWSNPIRISKHAGNCVDSDSTMEGAIPSVGPNGEIYVVWTGPNGFVFNKSLDGGLTWLDEETSVIDMPGGWDYTIGGLQRCNGLPQMRTDLSGGPSHGTIYINWTDQRNGSHDTDVWVIKSIDGGNSWSSPVRVNDDVSGRQQFLTWMDVDQSNGNIYCVFYDRRNYSSISDSTDVYLAHSTDGGNTFSNHKINETSFEPSPSVFFGDYISISAVNDIIRPIWMAYDGSTLSVWTALIDGSTIGLNDSEINAYSPVDLRQNEPNPFNESTWIKFELNQPTKINLSVSDVLGNKVATLFDNEQFKAGNYDYIFNAVSYGLKSGIYYYTLENQDYKITKKMIVF